jgi:DNA repair ATPase RecN
MRCFSAEAFRGAFLRVFGPSIAQHRSRAAIYALPPTPAVGDNAIKPTVADDGSNIATLNFATKKALNEFPHGLSAVMTCFNNGMMMMHAVMMQLDAKIDSINLNHRQIEARVDQIEANDKRLEVNHDRIKANNDRIEWNVDRIEARVEVDRSEFRAFRSK